MDQQQQQQQSSQDSQQSQQQQQSQDSQQSQQQQQSQQHSSQDSQQSQQQSQDSQQQSQQSQQSQSSQQSSVPKIGADGKLAENWFLDLGDEFAPHAKDLSKHKDIRSIITELDYYRKNGAEYPNANSPQNAVDRFRKIAGVPESPEGYGLTAENIKLPEGAEFDAELANSIAEVAHKTHTPPAAVAAIVEKFNEVQAKRMIDAQVAQAKAMQAAQDALVADWKGDFQTNASTVRHIAGKLAETAGLEPDDPSIQTLANTPAFARMMLEVSKLTAEDRIATPSGFGDLKSAAQKIADIKAGNDPVWSPKYNGRNEQDKVAAYEHIKKLREEAGI